MKKLLLFIFVLTIAFLLVGNQFQSLKVSASGETPKENDTQDRQREPNDAALASFIERLTNRSSDGLVEKQLSNGGVTLDLDERYQNVMLSKVNVYGDLEATCVTSLEEADRFFGRNLKTGEYIYAPEYQSDPIKRTAARHGMSVEEFQYYQKLIDNAMRRTESPQLATINIINGDGADEGFNDPLTVATEGGNEGTTRGAQRQNLFNFAAEIWGAFLDSSVPIQINSQFNPLTPCTTSGGVLGSAGTVSINRDFPGAEFPATWYHIALANKRQGADGVPGSPDINARFNSDVDTGCLGAGTRFYYGLNNSTPPGRINLLIVLLHEMGHGLGFSSFVNGQTGALFQGLPDVFTHYMYDRTIEKHWDDMTGAERQASAVNAGNVVWDGANIRIASGFLFSGRDSLGRVQLNVPATFQGGSSISHFDTATSPDLLMEPFIRPGLPLTLDLTRQQTRDIGWYRDTNTDQIPDTITDVQPNGGNIQIGSSYTITWSNNGGFNQPVTIELSTDGGTTYTVLAVNVTNTGSFTLTVPNLATANGKIRVREYDFIEPSGVSSRNFSISTNPTAAAADRQRFDFDGDGKADISVFRPSNGAWYIQRSTSGFTGISFGNSTDLTAPADFDGDGKTDVAVFRPSGGAWYYLKSSDNSFVGVTFGQNGDVPRPADFDGDGKADINVFRPSNGAWYRLNSSNGGFFGVSFGQSGDLPLVADFDGDSKADITVFRPTAGAFYWLNSSTGAFQASVFGVSTDIPTPFDFDGDGKTDIAVFRPSNGAWYRLNSSNGAFVGVSFGQNGDIPVAADYDGDGKADIAVFRPSGGAWYRLNSSTNSFFGFNFGATTDKPVPAAFVDQ